MRYSSATTGLLMTAVSAICFSTLPIFAVSAYRAGANVTTVLGIRFLLAGLILWGLLLASRRPLPDLRTGLLLFLMGGAGYTTMSVLYLSSVEQDRLSPSLAALLLYTYPAIVALEARLFDKYNLTVQQVGALLVTLAGTALVLVAPGSGTRFTPAGAALALGAALVYATYILFGSRVTRRTHPLAATTYVSTAAAIVFLGGGALAGELVPMALPGWWAAGGMALVATVMAVVLFFAGIERVGPARASIISTLEPVGTVALSVALFGEALAVTQMVGGAMVLGGVIWLQSRKGS